MARKKITDLENKYSRPVRTYVRPGTYKKLRMFCEDLNITSVSFVARRMIEILDDYPEKKEMLMELFGINQLKLSKNNNE
jgi:hypothetical protein